MNSSKSFFTSFIVCKTHHTVICSCKVLILIVFISLNECTPTYLFTQMHFDSFQFGVIMNTGAKDI